MEIDVYYYDAGGNEVYSEDVADVVEFAHDGFAAGTLYRIGDTGRWADVPESEVCDDTLLWRDVGTYLTEHGMVPLNP